MNKFFIFLSLVFFISSCAIKNDKEPWESAIIQYEMTSCFQSLKNVYYKNNFEKMGRIWNDDKAVAYCSCTVDNIRKNHSQDDYMTAKSEKRSGKILKENSGICKNRYGNWYDEE